MLHVGYGESRASTAISTVDAHQVDVSSSTLSTSGTMAKQRRLWQARIPESERLLPGRSTTHAAAASRRLQADLPSALSDAPFALFCAEYSGSCVDRNSTGRTRLPKTVGTLRVRHRQASTPASTPSMAFMSLTYFHGLSYHKVLSVLCPVGILGHVTASPSNETSRGSPFGRNIMRTLSA